MKYSLYVNQTKAIEWGLNLSQAVLFSFIYELPSWADSAITNHSPRLYYCSKNKILKELPLLSDKMDTVYRLIKQLEEKGLIIYLKDREKDFFAVSDKGKNWNNSEINPDELGNKSENGSENFPIDYNTNTDTYTIDRAKGPKQPISNEEKIYDAKISFLKKVKRFVMNNPNKYPKGLYLEFCRHWFETNSSGTKMRFQEQKFFDHGKRLSTWFQNARNETLDEQWKAEPSLPSFERVLLPLLEPIPLTRIKQPNAAYQQ